MTAAPKDGSRSKLQCRDTPVRQARFPWREADVPGEEVGKCTQGGRRGMGPGDHARGTGPTSGRTPSQQGAGSNLQRPRVRGKTAAAQRGGVWRMSPYERRRRGNAFSGGLRGHPGSHCRAKGLWALGGHMRHPHQTLIWALRTGSLWGEGMGQRSVTDADASQRLSAAGATEGPSPINRVRAEARTGLGKSDRPGSQGGRRKRGPWWNWEPIPQPKGRTW